MNNKYTKSQILLASELAKPFRIDAERIISLLDDAVEAEQQIKACHLKKCPPTIPDTEYILQSVEDDRTCEMIAIANAFIHTRGVSPLPKYNSKDWYDLHDSSRNNPEITFDDLLEGKYNIQIIPLTSKTSKELKNKFIETIKEGNTVSCGAYINGMGHHACLLVDYDVSKDAFKVINAQKQTTKDPIEYLTFAQLGSSRLLLDNGFYLSESKKHITFNILNASKKIVIK